MTTASEKPAFFLRLAMARYYSDDGVFDAPIEKVWRLIDAHDDATVKEIHPGTVSQRTVERIGASVVRDVANRLPDGRIVDSRIRFIRHEPYAQTLEFVTGPFAGSWQTSTYVPEGARTRVITVGEFRLAGAPEEAALAAGTAFVDHAHEEDKAYLKRIS